MVRNMKYKAYRIINGKPRWVIVDENGDIVNRNSSKCELKGLDKFPEKDGRYKYTDQELLDYLRHFEKENGRVPLAIDFLNNPEYPHSNTFMKRFGSWNDALKFAELDTNGYTDEELLDYLDRFYYENERVPVAIDFINNPEYPNCGTYQYRFGSWSNALKLVGLDVDTMVKQGIVVTTNQKARLAEIMIRDHFKKNPVDLSGQNQNSPCDGICPNGKMYDVKSSKLYKGTHWRFRTDNKYKEEIEIYYFLAFNKDYTKLEYTWRVPAEIVEKDNFYIGLNPSYEFDFEEMEEYNITDRFIHILKH